MPPIQMGGSEILDTMRGFGTPPLSEIARSVKQIIAGPRQLLTTKGWQVSRDARIALLYLIGKGKSLYLPVISWRPICALAHPIVPRY